MRHWIALAFALLCCTTQGAEWLGFRGNTGDGSIESDEYPVHWNSEQGIAWVADLPQGGNGSPIVADGRVLLTSAEDVDGKTRSLLCLDSKTGALQWKRSVDFGRKMPTHKTNPYAGSTPASDGRVVVVWHGSAGLHCYNLKDGIEVWTRDLGEFVHMWGYGTSPVISGNRVIMHAGPGKNVFVAAIDLKSGKDVWRHEEPVDGNGERNDDQNYMGSWSTPLLINQEGREIAVVAFATRVVGLDAETGEVAWFCNGLSGERGDLAYSSPMIERDVCVMIGGFKGPGMAFELGGKGDLTSKQLWRNTKNPQNIGTGVLQEGYVYRVGAGPTTIDCLNARTGEKVWEQRVGSKAFWSSIVYHKKRAYAIDQAGRTVVFKLSPDGYQEMASNALSDTCNSTPAFADGRIFVRTYAKLWAIDGQR